MITNILSKLKKVVTKPNDTWMACCPAHQDKSPSLSISQSNDGKILLYCFAGCSIEEITDALGIDLSQLFPDSHFNRSEYYHQLKQSQYKEILSNEKMIVAIAEAEVKRNQELGSKDRARHLLALSRIKKLEVLIHV
jgi:hypothetical protein